MLSPVIVKLIEDKMQKSIRYASDYDYLSYDIEKSTGKNISTNTLKRLLGYMEGVKAPRLYTLDVVAEYLGYVDWDDLNQKVLSNDSSSSFSTIEEIDIQHLIFFLSLLPEGQYLKQNESNCQLSYNKMA